MSSEQNQIEENEEAASREMDKIDDESLDSGDEVETRTDTENEAEEGTEQQLEQAQATIKEYWDQIIRLKAEMENSRKRAGRDIENAHKYALRNFAESLLPVIDSMELGQQAAEAENASLSGIEEGTQMTMTMFVQALEKHGLKQIDPLGEPFNPDQHQAISMVEDEEAEHNVVIKVMQKGFLLNDRLVRPAMVVVSK